MNVGKKGAHSWEEWDRRASHTTDFVRSRSLRIPREEHMPLYVLQIYVKQCNKGLKLTLNSVMDVLFFRMGPCGGKPSDFARSFVVGAAANFADISAIDVNTNARDRAATVHFMNIIVGGAADCDLACLPVVGLIPRLRDLAFLWLLEADLMLNARVDANNAPGLMRMNRSFLFDVPYCRGNTETTGRVDVQRVHNVAISVGFGH